MIEDKFRNWEKECEERFSRLKANEEELNRIFIDLYGLGSELSPEVDASHVSVSRALLSREIRSLVSYAVGCVFGRYSPDREGLCFAGGQWDESCYRQVIPVEDNIISFSETGTGYDVTKRLTDFVGNVYGQDVLAENMSYIAGALGGKGSTESIIRDYLMNDFYADHVRTYRKRPIYWMVTSGERKAFRSLFYIHRFEPSLFDAIRRGPLAARMAFLEIELDSLMGSSDISACDRERTEKKILELSAQTAELEDLSKRLEKLSGERVILDPDMGIKHNYGLLSDILERI